MHDCALQKYLHNSFSRLIGACAYMYVISHKKIVYTRVYYLGMDFIRYVLQFYARMTTVKKRTSEWEQSRIARVPSLLHVYTAVACL